MLVGAARAGRGGTVRRRLAFALVAVIAGLVAVEGVARTLPEEAAQARGIVMPPHPTRAWTLQTPEGPRGVFFFSYAELQKGLAKVPNRDQLKPQVADLSAVLREIIKAKDDSYVIFPTPDYFRLVQENQGKGTPAAK